MVDVNVMAGHSRPKDGVASARLCPGHPRLCFQERETWMPGTRPGMTEKMLRSRFGLTLPVFLRAFPRSDSPLDKIYLH
jgi:hypothetical protein